MVSNPVPPVPPKVVMGVMVVQGVMGSEVYFYCILIPHYPVAPLVYYIYCSLPFGLYPLYFKREYGPKGNATYSTWVCSTTTAFLSSRGQQATDHLFTPITAYVPPKGVRRCLTPKGYG